MNYLPVAILEEISTRIQDGGSIRGIAREFGVDRKTVYNLKYGKINLNKRRKMRTREEHEEEREITMKLFSRPHSRCGECGRKVQKPCLYCCLSNNDLEALKPLLMEEDDGEEISSLFRRNR